MRSPGFKRDRYSCGGSSVSQPTPVVNQYDPQVGAAAAQEAQTAAQAQQFTQNYYQQYVTPALQAQQQQSADSAAQQKQIVDAELAQMKTQQDQQNTIYSADVAAQQQQQDMYNKYGLPAVQNFYDQSAAFSTPAYQEQQAAGALGDQRTAFQSQQGALQRSLAQAGISSSSPAAVQAMADARTQEAAQEAAASTRARTAAQTMGLQVAGNAANLAQGFSTGALNAGGGASGAAGAGTSGTASTGQVGSGASSGALGAASTGLTGAISGASVPMAGYSAAQGGYGNVLNAWTNLSGQSIQSGTALSKAYMDAQAQAASGEASGVGGFLGSALSAAGNIWSDRQLKTNVRPVGQIMVKGRRVPVYDFEYVFRPGQVRGVMADEVEQIIPEAVVTTALGLKMVDYAKLEAA
jgi:hypothetical protein